MSEDIKPPTSMGWVIFLSGLFISTFFGGAVRAFLSPAQLSKWVENRISEKKPKFYLNFDHLEFKLSDGMWPKFGFQARGLNISSRDLCQSQSQLGLREAYIPINIFRLFRGEVKFSDIETRGVRFLYREPLCNSQVEAESLLRPPTPLDLKSREETVGSSSSAHFFKKFMANRFIKELKNSRKWFDSLELHDVEIVLDSESPQTILISKLSVDLNKYVDKMIVYGQFQPTLQDLKIEGWRPFNFEVLVSSSEISLLSRGRLREGEVNILGNLAPETGNFHLQLDFKYFPLIELFKTIGSFKSFTGYVEPKLSWFSCHISLSGAVHDYRNAFVQLGDCGVKGESGKIFTDNVSIAPFGDFKYEPFQVDIQDFPMVYILEVLKLSFNLEPSSAIINWGKVDGYLDFQKEGVKFVGKIKNLEASVSFRDKKRLQLVRVIDGEVEWKGGRTSGIINNIDIDGGEFEGLLSFNFDQQLLSGVIQSHIKSVKMNRHINNQLFVLDPTPFEILGKVRVKNRKLEELQGVIGVSSAHRAGVKIEKIKVDTKYSQSYWDLRVKAETVQIDRSNSLHAELKKVFILEDSDEDFFIENLRGTLLLGSNYQGEWLGVYAREKNLGILLSSQAKWNELGELKGWLNVEKKNKKWLTWDLFGNILNIRFSPSLSLLKSIRPEHSTVNLSVDLSLEDRIGAFDKIMISRRGEELKSFKEKIMDTARSWVPDFFNLSDKSKKQDSQ